MNSFAKILAIIIVSITSAIAEDYSDKKFDPALFVQNSSIKIPVLEMKTNLLNECKDGQSRLNNNGNIEEVWNATNKIVKEIYTCERKKFNMLRFSPDSCSDALKCRKNFADIYGQNSDKLMNEIVAKNYAKNMLKVNTPTMDKLEILKRFAASKYNINSDKCNSRYQPPKSSAKCNLTLLDEVFLDEQENCERSGTCSQMKGLTNFKDYKTKNVIPDVAFIVDYNEYRIGHFMGLINQGSDPFVDELAKFVTSDQLKKLTSEQKAEMVLNKLGSEKWDTFLDPVLAFDFDSVLEKEQLKKTSKYKLFLKIFEKNDATEESFKSAFESFRKSRAEEILQQSGTCSENVDLKQICEEMTMLSKGEQIFKNPLALQALSSRDLSKEKDYEKFKSFMGNAFTAQDYNTLLDAKRCISFGLAREEKSYSWGTVLKESSSKSYRARSSQDFVGPNENSVVTSKDEVITGNLGEKPKSEAVKMLEPKTDEINTKSDSISTAISNSQIANNNSAIPFKQSFRPGAYGLDNDEKDEKLEKREEATIVTNPSISGSVDSNMSDLMKRLTAAEEKVDKMKADNEEAENERTKQKKIDEENLLIKELKGQIADLKATKEKKEAEKSVAVVSPVIEQQKSQSSSFASGLSGGSMSAPVRQEPIPKVADNYDSARSAPTPSSEAPTSSRSSGPAMLTSTNNEGARVLPSGMSLTTVDGMSSEKATQTISNRIIELNGTPFYIEEGGLVKEIIAVIKDGKVLLDEKGNPIYEKIVKGKIGDKKFAKIKEKNRAPAAITDIADLKRDQEEKLKRDRVEYLKLKNLTNGIMKKK